MLLRAATPSLIWDVDRRLRGSIRGNGANVIRGVAALLVFVVVGRDVVDFNRRMDCVKIDSFELSGDDAWSVRVMGWDVDIARHREVKLYKTNGLRKSVFAMPRPNNYRRS